MFSKKIVVALFNLWILQEQNLSIHNITVRGTYPLDGYDIMAFYQNLDENEWDFYFRNHTAVLYRCCLNKVT